MCDFSSVKLDHHQPWRGAAAGSAEPGARSFGAPTALCVLGDDVYVCDGVNRRVSVLRCAVRRDDPIVVFLMRASNRRLRPEVFLVRANQ